MGKILALAEVVDLVQKAQRMGKTVVTTNGAFDLLHPGHLFLLEEARKRGDVLIVGVNSDRRIKESKGEDRPVEPENVRAANVAEYADAVFIFDDPDPREFLKAIKPDVHVNAETYGEDCVEAEVLKEIGAKLALVPVKRELGSTTEILADVSIRADRPDKQHDTL